MFPKVGVTGVPKCQSLMSLDAKNLLEIAKYLTYMFTYGWQLDKR